MVMDVNKDQRLEGTSEEAPTKQEVASPARSGPTLNQMITRSPFWAITISAGILLGLDEIKFGVTPIV